MPEVVGIVSERPSRGVRVRLERTDSGYAGAATTPDAKWQLAVTIDASGDVSVTSDAPESVRDRVRLIVRTEVRHATADGLALPRVIQRWRPEKE